jgi:predicted DsbA family dithiol-disulfide isomerase
MDNELKEYLDAMRVELRQEMDSMRVELRQEIRNSEQRTVALVVEVKESLEREVRTIGERLGVMSSRVDRMVAASNVVSRLVEWADRQDKVQEESLERFQSIESRLDKLGKPPEK